MEHSSQGNKKVLWAQALIGNLYVLVCPYVRRIFCNDFNLDFYLKTFLRSTFSTLVSTYLVASRYCQKMFSFLPAIAADVVREKIDPIESNLAT